LKVTFIKPIFTEAALADPSGWRSMPVFPKEASARSDPSQYSSTPWTDFRAADEIVHSLGFLVATKRRFLQPSKTSVIVIENLTFDVRQSQPIHCTRIPLARSVTQFGHMVRCLLLQDFEVAAISGGTNA
jgi:hypothetical protein